MGVVSVWCGTESTAKKLPASAFVAFYAYGVCIAFCPLHFHLAALCYQNKRGLHGGGVNRHLCAYNAQVFANGIGIGGAVFYALHQLCQSRKNAGRDHRGYGASCRRYGQRATGCAYGAFFNQVFVVHALLFGRGVNFHLVYQVGKHGVVIVHRGPRHW